MNPMMNQQMQGRGMMGGVNQMGRGMMGMNNQMMNNQMMQGRGMMGNMNNQMTGMGGMNNKFIQMGRGMVNNQQMNRGMMNPQMGRGMMGVNTNQMGGRMNMMTGVNNPSMMQPQQRQPMNRGVMGHTNQNMMQQPQQQRQNMSQIQISQQQTPQTGLGKIPLVCDATPINVPMNQQLALGCQRCQMRVMLPMNYRQGTPIPCSSCQTVAKVASCVHCNTFLRLSPQWKDEDIIRCGRCMKTFQFYFCPHCSNKINYPNSNYKSGKVTQCPFCKKGFQQQNCVRCNKSLCWRNADCSEGKPIKCPTCMNSYIYVFCKHCDRKILNNNYVEGKVQKCPFNNCGKLFQTLGCVHCHKVIIFNQANYKEGTLVKCPQRFCQRSFQQLNCPCCSKNVIWRNADKNHFQGGVRTCPMCMQSYQHFNCQYCRNPMFVKNNFIQRGKMMVQCPYQFCRKSFNPFHDISMGQRRPGVHFPQQQQQRQMQQQQLQRGGGGMQQQQQQRQQVVLQASPLVMQTIQRRMRYTDPQFPPNDRSIGNVGDRYDWMRAPQIIGEGVCMFDGIEADDIKQGSLGDCWFLSAVSILCAYPSLIQKLFITKQMNASGIYELQFCKGGKWVRVIIDDYLPVNKGTKKLAFTKANGKELWVLLLEKAYAKLHGSYANIESGRAQEALSDLSGFPVGRYDFDDEVVMGMMKRGGDEFFRCIFQHSYMGHRLTVSTKGSVSKQQTGLVPGHAYSVLQISPRHHLLQIRNPWSHFESKLPYNDKDYRRWTTELKRELYYEDADDGAFWIQWSDICKYFSNFCVALINPSWCEKRSMVTNENTCFIISVFSSHTQVVGGIHQRDKRGMQNRKTLHYKPIGFVIATMDGGVIQYQGMKLERTHHSIVSGGNKSGGGGSGGGGQSAVMTLSPGKYMLIPIFLNTRQAISRNDVVVSFHSNCQIGMQPTQFDWKNKIPMMVGKSFRQGRKNIFESSGREVKSTVSKGWYGTEFYRHRIWINGEILLFLEWKVKGQLDKVEYTVKWEVENMIPIAKFESVVILPGELKFVGWFVKESQDSYSFAYSSSKKSL